MSTWLYWACALPKMMIRLGCRRLVNHLKSSGLEWLRGLRSNDLKVPSTELILPSVNQSCSCSSGVKFQQTCTRSFCDPMVVTEEDDEVMGPSWGSSTEVVPLPSEQKSLKVAVIGTPNAGKSTLVNKLMGQKVLAVSPKVHTTKRKAVGIFTEGNTQIVFMDTPGLISNRYARSLGMSREFTADPFRSMMEADLVMVMVDAANKFTRERLDENILRVLQQYPHVTSVLVLNKVDLLKKKFLLLKLAEKLTGSIESKERKILFHRRKLKNRYVPEADKKKSREEMHLLKAEVSNETKARKSYLERLIKEANLKLNTSSGITLAGERSECLGNHTPLKPLAGQDLLVSPKDQTSSPPEATTEPRPYIPSDHWPFFEEVFMISALEEDGLDKIMQYLLSSGKERSWEYSPSELTDQSGLELVENVIQEKIYCYTDREMPYVVKQENVLWERDEEGTLLIHQYLHCGKKSRIGILVGSQGNLIHTISEEASADIEKLLQCRVNLVLFVKK